MTRTAPHPDAPPPRTAPIASAAGAAAAQADERYPIIAREGWPIIIAIDLATLVIAVGLFFVCGLAGAIPALAIGGLVIVWSVWFFRDPPRRTPAALFVAPADGVVSFVGPSTPPTELGLSGPFTRVSIFMNIFNVHVNRCPCDAKVAAVHYRSGKFFNASLDKASEHNERCALRLTLPDGNAAACVQIAGLIARRIVCRAKAGDGYRAGQRFGLIRFGSRVDVYLPADLAPLVKLGQATVAGETILVAPAGLRDAEVR